MPASPQKQRSSTNDNLVDPIQWNTGPNPSLGVVDNDDEGGDDERATHKNPMLDWIEETDTFVREFLQLESRGDMEYQAACASCTGLIPTSYQCSDCVDNHLHCAVCMAQMHQTLPFHRINVCHVLIV
jgi:hypothetical protein